MNVTAALTKGYENKSNWAICENEPKTNPIKANIMPKQTQYEPNQSQLQRQKMLLRTTINPRPNSLASYPGQIEAPNANGRMAAKYPGRFKVSKYVGLEKLDKLPTKEYQIDKYCRPIQQKRKDFISFIYKVLRLPGCSSAWPERLLWEQEVAGSNPVTPIFTVRIQFLTPNKLHYPNSYTLITHLVVPICPFPILLLLKRSAYNYRTFPAYFAPILEKRYMIHYKFSKKNVSLTQLSPPMAQ